MQVFKLSILQQKKNVNPKGGESTEKTPLEIPDHSALLVETLTPLHCVHCAHFTAIEQLRSATQGEETCHIINISLQDALIFVMLIK